MTIEQTQDLLQKLATNANQIICETTGGLELGFAILIFNPDNSSFSAINYVTNCDPPEVINAMKEFITRVENSEIEHSTMQ